MKCSWCNRGESVFVQGKESHGICPTCMERMIVEDMEAARLKSEKNSNSKREESKSVPTDAGSIRSKFS